VLPVLLAAYLCVCMKCIGEVTYSSLHGHGVTETK